MTEAGLSGAAEVFGGAPFGGSRLAMAGFESGLVGAGLSGVAVAACGDGAAGAGKSTVGATPEDWSLALRLGGAAAAFPPLVTGFAAGSATATADGLVLSATFSPDGKWITFARTPGTGKGGNADIFTMRADGTRVRNVTRSASWDSGVDWGARR